MKYPILTAEEAASLIKNDYTIGIGGFSSVGTPKAIPSALAKHAQALHEKGEEFRVGLITGGATGKQIDTELSLAHAVKFRTPFQSNKDMRAAINSGEVQYFDVHLSMIGQDVNYGFLGKIDVAIVEASDITEDGKIILSTSVGISPTLVLGVVMTDCRDNMAPFTPLNEETQTIGNLVADFLVKELKNGGIPKEFLPLQSGVGNVANAVLGALGDNPEVPAFSMFTEVIQNSVMDLIMKGRCNYVTGSSLSLTEDALNMMYDNMNVFGNRVLLRPQEITNHPELIRRMGIIALNTALEADIFGNINSTHVSGTKMMNGIGGSADFARNAYLSIFTTPSTAKGGLISSIVPMVTHTDSSEHSVRVIVTEQGVADLRGKSPSQRARLIIENCAHPDYKQLLWDYLKLSEGKGLHTPHSLQNAFKMHIALAETGDMRNCKFA